MEKAVGKSVWPLFIVWLLVVGAVEVAIGFVGLLFFENGERFFGACLVTGSMALVICSIGRFWNHWSMADGPGQQVLLTCVEKGIVVFSANTVLVIILMIVFKALFIEDEPWPSTSSCLVYAAVVNTAWVWLFTTFRKNGLWKRNIPADTTEIVVMVNAMVGFVTAILLVIARGELVLGICVVVNAVILWAMSQPD